MNKYEKAMIRLGLDFTDKELMAMFEDDAKADILEIKKCCEKALNYDKSLDYDGKYKHILINRKYYYRLEKEERKSKNKYDNLKKEKARFLKKCERWLELLRTDGINSKLMVANDIQAILNDVKKELE